jgi:uncharacterized membrane protein YoaK (UPF0700 family)
MKNKKSKPNTPIHIVGFILTVVAGWINTTAMYVFLSENSSFLTGRVAKLGKHILNGNKAEIKRILFIIVFFIVGSYISTLITQKAGLSHGLYFSGTLIILTLLIFYIAEDTIIAFITLPMCMGGQNAATSLTSVSRTTHLTGPFTDIGINIAKGNWKQALFWILRGMGFLIGAAAAYFIVGVCSSKGIILSKTLIAPAVVIIVTAFFQKRFLGIELLKVK